ncbi:hypothetical protein MHU86_10943 [Fragilaria crotonensis]|nr:hypothetical protein MHU86_10943 [Fragilaria crotonensis]
MVFSNDVDICVTCVADKPPKLPLREELVSLGVEVIYKAAGVGVDAVRRESKRQVREYREQIQRSKSVPQLSPENDETPEQEIQSRMRQRMIEREIYKNRSSLTYEAYSRRLNRQNSSDSDSLDSLNSVPKIGTHSRVPESGNDTQVGVATEEREGAGSPVTEHQDWRVQENAQQEVEDEKCVDACMAPALSPSKSEILSNKPPNSPQTAATSPTPSHTSFGFGSNGDDMVSPLNDDDSVGSTIGKDDGKVLVSGTGIRWWYQQQDDIPEPRTPQEARAEEADTHGSPPLISILYSEERNDTPSGPATSEPCTNRGTMGSSCCSHTYKTLCGCGAHKELRGGTGVDSAGDPIVECTGSVPVLQEPSSTPVSAADADKAWLVCNFAEVCGSLSQVQNDEPANSKTSESATVMSDGTDVISNRRVDIDLVISDRSSSTDESGVPQSPTDEGNHVENEGTDMGSSCSSNSSAESDAEASTTSSDLSQIITMPEYSCLSATNKGGEANVINGRRSMRRLFTSLSQAVVSIADIQKQFAESPALARAMTTYDGRLALHVACERNLPDRFSDRSVTLIKKTLDMLIIDIIDWRSIVSAVMAYNEEACMNVDRKGDLPVHIAARRLIEWEGQWRTRFAGIGAMDEDDADKIDVMYREMSRCVEILLDPILSSNDLCQEGGSVGRILPLHIACIFTLSSDKAKALLHTYPRAAGVPCILTELLTLIEDNAFPIELLERERTLGTLVKSNLRRSDVEADEPTFSDHLLAFYPSVQPFCSDPHRLARLEYMVKTAARQLRKSKTIDDSSAIDPAAKSAWVWLCTSGGEGETGSCATNVAELVNSLEIEEVELLANLETDSGTIMSIASHECTTILKSRLTMGSGMSDVFAANDKADPGTICVQPSSSPPDSTLTGLTNKQINRKSEAQPSTKVFGSMLKVVFNVREISHPSSFIILPYKLVIGANGSLTLEDPAAASMALKFAKYLLEMTHPSFLAHQLEKKAIQHAAYKVPAHQMEQWTLTEEKHRNIQREFIDVYRAGPGYMYLLDEKDSTPIITGEKGEVYYPVRIEDPVETVRRMMSLMLMGMIHMRGRKSVSTLAKTIMESGLSAPDAWVATAETILELLSNDIDENDTVLSEAMSCRDDLEHFVNAAKRNNSQRRSNTTDDGYEWVVELTLLKIILERSDIRRSFAGLAPISMPTGSIVWTKSKIELLSHAKQCSRSFDSDSRADTESSLSDDLQCLLENSSPGENACLAFEAIDGAEAVGGAELRETTCPEIPLRSTSVCSVESLQSLRSIESDALEPSDSHDTFASQDIQSDGARNSLVLSDTGELDLILHDSPVQATQPPPSYDISVALSWHSSTDSKGSNESVSSSACAARHASRNWRYQLEMQEAQLEHIRDKLAALDVSDEDQLSLRGEALIDDLSQHLNRYDLTAATACYDNGETNDLDVTDGKETTKMLLTRLCLLEERLLSREIELEQIKLELHNFEIETISQSKQWHFNIN